MPTCGWAPAVKFSCGGLERQLYFGRKRSRVENQERDGNNREGVIFLRLLLPAGKRKQIGMAVAPRLIKIRSYPYKQYCRLLSRLYFPSN